jgi:hypothetical protein
MHLSREGEIIEVETSLVVRSYGGVSWCTLLCYGMLGKGGQLG